jgi:hypothetical protein
MDKRSRRMIALEALKEIYIICADTNELGKEFTEDDARACDQALSDILAIVEDNFPEVGHV